MIKSETAHLIVKAGSHPGRTGKENEDRFGVTGFQTREQRGEPSLLAVLCDGIGGQRAGEVAAEMGVEIITRHVAESSPNAPLKTLEEALHKASAAIYEAAQSDRGRSGMGTTCACAWIIGRRLYTANLGDSRIYLLRGKDFIQLSTDHTWLQEAREAGLIPEGEDLSGHPNAHVIRRYLGSKTVPQPDFRLWVFEGESDAEALRNQGLQLEPGDTLLLCSDGLTDLVRDEEIRAILRGHRVADIPDILIRMANERGGHDNITVVIAKMPPGKSGPLASLRKGQVVIGCLLAVLVISILVTAILVGIRWRSQRPPTPTPQTTQTLLLPGPQEAEPSPTATIPATPTATVPAQHPRPSITPWPTDTPGP
jgi:protein phosphatase